MAQRRLRRERQLGVLAAQHAEQPAQLVERLAAGGLDRGERLARELRAGQRQAAARRWPARSWRSARARRRRAARPRSARARRRRRGRRRPRGGARAAPPSRAARGCSAARQRSRRPTSTGAPTEITAVKIAARDRGVRRRRARWRRCRAAVASGIPTTSSPRVARRPSQYDGDERGRERHEQLLVVASREHRQQRHRREHRRAAPASGYARPATTPTPIARQDQRRERRGTASRRDEQRQLQLELERRRRARSAQGDGGDRARIAGKSDVRLPVCPRTQGRSGRHPEG